MLFQQQSHKLRARLRQFLLWAITAAPLLRCCNKSTDGHQSRMWIGLDESAASFHDLFANPRSRVPLPASAADNLRPRLVPGTNLTRAARHVAGLRVVIPLWRSVSSVRKYFVKSRQPKWNCGPGTALPEEGKKGEHARGPPMVSMVLRSRSPDVAWDL